MFLTFEKKNNLLYSTFFPSSLMFFYCSNFSLFNNSVLPKHTTQTYAQATCPYRSISLVLSSFSMENVIHIVLCKIWGIFSYNCSRENNKFICCSFIHSVEKTGWHQQRLSYTFCYDYNTIQLKWHKSQQTYYYFTCFQIFGETFLVWKRQGHRLNLQLNGLQNRNIMVYNESVKTDTKACYTRSCIDN